jgi:hypothetical protein
MEEIISLLGFAMIQKLTWFLIKGTKTLGMKLKIARIQNAQ